MHWPQNAAQRDGKKKKTPSRPSDHDARRLNAEEDWHSKVETAPCGPTRAVATSPRIVLYYRRGTCVCRVLVDNVNRSCLIRTRAEPYLSAVGVCSSPCCSIRDCGAIIAETQTKQTQKSVLYPAPLADSGISLKWECLAYSPFLFPAFRFISMLTHFPSRSPDISPKAAAGLGGKR